MELHRATGKQRYVEKAVELARIVVASQQKQRVGTDFPLSGFFYTGPDRDTLFHQFHRGADQAPIVGLAQLIDQARLDHHRRIGGGERRRENGADRRHVGRPLRAYADVGHGRRT